ncbi:glutathione S-transferase [Rhodovulum bhavnagarense]|uniref:Glutathione S-transferase n=1 Tax=Rhodovulum bhavnagarense TaxID=992286 RepID=A0A4V2SWM9_9RHOB|nr:glutathione S-transferase family protein [Rhodovulum bhavnagarense]TCP62926.1 glutathione S-transferase [Rhodovulum bhavnagarense]
MLTLHVFAPALGTISPSPFSVKALLLMEMSGLPYTRATGDPRKAPKGKLPLLVDSGRTIADSQAIQHHLAMQHGFDPDAHLSPRQRAEALMLRVTLEEHLYWALVQSRWIESPEPIREAFFGRLPKPMGRAVFAMVRRKVARALNGQGMGRHTPGEILAIAEEALEAVVTMLGDGPHVFGPAPSGVDASLFGFLENVLVPPLDTPLKRAVQSRAPLVAYHRRLRDGLAARLTC